METFKAFAMRKSSRGFKPGQQIPDEALEKILDAGCIAPVGMGAYDKMHLAVVRDSALIEKLSDEAKAISGRSGGPGVFYDAPTIIVISSEELRLQNIIYANGSCVATQMLLAATDLGIGNIFIWAANALSGTEIAAEIGIPEGYIPVATVALGYPIKESDEERPFERKIKISRR